MLSVTLHGLDVTEPAKRARDHVLVLFFDCGAIFAGTRDQDDCVQMPIWKGESA